MFLVFDHLPLSDAKHKPYMAQSRPKHGKIIPCITGHFFREKMYHDFVTRFTG